MVKDAGGKLVTDASGRVVITFYDQGLATESAAFKTFIRELDHIETFEATGVFSSEAQAEARAIAAARDMR